MSTTNASVLAKRYSNLSGSSLFVTRAKMLMRSNLCAGHFVTMLSRFPYLFLNFKCVCALILRFDACLSTALMNASQSQLWSSLTVHTRRRSWLCSVPTFSTIVDAAASGAKRIWRRNSCACLWLLSSAPPRSRSTITHTFTYPP